MLAFYYSQIQAGNTDPVLLKDYAIVESLVAGVDPQKVVYTIDHENKSWKPEVVHYNDMKIGCDSVGLVQIRDCNHPDVSFEQATDPIFSVNFLIKNINKCNTWWKNTCGNYKLSRDT